MTGHVASRSGDVAVMAEVLRSKSIDPISIA